ncbi:galactose mutarotase [Mycobacterium sp. DSM 3803]|nr:galactose mutarotase [Mycobacterium sp. DSM 3803]
MITLRNEHCTAVLTDLGARLLELHLPDRDGQFADVVLGRPDMTQTLSDPHYMGSTAGRFANRIRGGRFTLDGHDYALATNEGRNHLHGGERGYDRYGWSTRVDDDGDAVTFTRISPDGEEGYPGELLLRVTYRLQGNTLNIEMSATTDRTTIVNLVNHAYWNLGGHDSGSVLDHTLQLVASHYTPVDPDELMPTGEIRSVQGTPFDFREARAIGERNCDVENSGAGRAQDASAGYDHNWVLDGRGTRVVAVVTDPHSGRQLQLSTNQPGIHVYVGGYLGGVSAKESTKNYPSFAGLTLETQTFPDAINHPHFPSPVLRPGETYLNTAQFTFSTD